MLVISLLVIVFTVADLYESRVTTMDELPLHDLSDFSLNSPAGRQNQKTDMNSDIKAVIFQSSVNKSSHQGYRNFENINNTIILAVSSPTNLNNSSSGMIATGESGDLIMNHGDLLYAHVPVNSFSNSIVGKSISAGNKNAAINQPFSDRSKDVFSIDDDPNNSGKGIETMGLADGIIFLLLISGIIF